MADPPEVPNLQQVLEARCILDLEAAREACEVDEARAREQARSAAAAQANREAGNTRRQEESVNRLREELNNHRLVICTGAGITLHSVDRSQFSRMTWPGLMRAGIDYLFDQADEFTDHDDIEQARALLDKDNPSSIDLLEAANRIRGLMAQRPHLR
ncbi:hypothetical protein GGR53DRAFT_526878 [Hypoxylon sp. FL1150]|nr:hypothetical protein GGR53DRAFT_526878 [Hypoxylon sp. FL1150]